jgi:phage terminase large subunit
VLGAILGKYIEKAEREGRMNDAVEFDPDGAPVEISSDIAKSPVAPAHSR